MLILNTKEFINFLKETLWFVQLLVISPKYNRFFRLNATFIFRILFFIIA